MTNNHLLLYRLAELMIEQGQHILPVDLLFGDNQIGDMVRGIQIDSPYQQMLLEGVLSESVKEGKMYVNFSVEGYFHFVLGEVIYDQSRNKEYTYLLHLLPTNSLNGLKEGIEQCLIREVHQGRLERLISLIDLGGEAEHIARFPLVHAFMKNRVEDVFQNLMANCSYHDWNIIKHVRGLLLLYQKQHIIDKLDSIIKESGELKSTIEELLNSEDEMHLKKSLVLISFFRDLNALDQAKHYYTAFIKVIEKRNDQELLVDALEQLGESEYKRSGQEGYKAAMVALTQAAEICESSPVSQNDKLKNVYRLLGFAYLSLGLQVIRSTEYFEKVKNLLLEESSDSAELAEINLYLGLVNFWRGLRAIGRWGAADASLLDGVNIDLFEYADSQFQLTYNYFSKNLGKSHPQTLKALHYLQENRYAMGNYEKAIPWLMKYVNVLPFKSREHTDNYYLYCLIVSLEEFSKYIIQTDKKRALSYLDLAIDYAKKYDVSNQLVNRLQNCRLSVEKDKVENPIYSSVSDLPPLSHVDSICASWSEWELSADLKGFHTNNWMLCSDGCWFYNLELKQLIFWDTETNCLKRYVPSDWPAGCGRFIFDGINKVFYAWSSIRSDVFQLSTPQGRWTRLSSGVHDVHACGASFGYDPVKNRLFEFGGYGYFTYKNWLWVYDFNERKWLQLIDNMPGIMPYPRNGQILPVRDRTSAVLVSGIGSDTGIQREHKARMGLPSATDVGYFTWLRDAYLLDLKTMEWAAMLAPNHLSIRHEGSMGYLESQDIVLNWSGTIPAEEFGKEPVLVRQLSCWKLSEPGGFKVMEFDGDEPPLTGGYFQSIPKTNQLLYIHPDNIWTLTVYDR